MSSHDSLREGSGLIRGLGVFDATMLTVGSVIGTGIFITTADIARVLPHQGLILLIWILGGLLSLAGALTYAELGALYPKAGGMYHFLKEAYGPLWGFLYGWACFLIIMSGGIAALAVAFGEYLGSFVPFFSTTHQLATVPIGGWTWTLSGGQIAAVAAILLLTAVNYLGSARGRRGSEPPGRHSHRLDPGVCRPRSPGGDPHTRHLLIGPSGERSADSIRCGHDRGALDLRRLVWTHILGG